MRFTLHFLWFVFVGCIFGCKQEPKKIEQATHSTAMVQNVSTPTGKNSALPYLSSHNGTTLLSWVETTQDSLYSLWYAEWTNGKWQKPQRVLEGSDWFVNWADFPMIAENKGNLWSHVLKKSTAGTYSYDVKMNVKPSQENEWETNLKLHTVGTPTEHGFVSVLPYENGFFVNWLDGRNTLENEVGERGAMTLRGAMVSTTGEVRFEQELDSRICDCCQTTAALTENGPVVLYRDRSEAEIRDIAIVRQVNGEWTAPKIIHADNWKIKGCPVNGPKVAANGNNLAVAWFTGAQQKQRVKLAFSNDGGARFQEPLLIAEGALLGRVGVVWLNAEEALVSWVAQKNGSTNLNVIKVAMTGEKGEAIVITQMNDTRKSGFPQMQVAGNDILFAWTAVGEETTRVQTAAVAKANF